MEAAGEAESRLADERAKYDARVQAYTSTNQFTPPLCKGVLVFDEVKVAAKLHWNSRNDTIVGHTFFWASTASTVAQYAINFSLHS